MTEEYASVRERMRECEADVIKLEAWLQVMAENRVRWNLQPADILARKLIDVLQDGGRVIDDLAAQRNHLQNRLILIEMADQSLLEETAEALAEAIRGYGEESPL